MDKHKTVKDRITAYLKDAVRAVQVENVETVEAIGSKETTNAICYAMEAIFLHGLKGSTTNKNFWPLVKKFTHKATLSQITELTQISTDVGRCRAWIRLALNDGALDSYCKVITSDSSTIRHYYDSSAYFRDVEQCNAMETHLQGLCNFMFNLAYNSTVLNQWTTTALVLSGMSTAGHLDWPNAVAATESFANQSALDVNLQRHILQSRSPVPFSTPIPTSSSCPQGLSDAVYDSSFQLSQSEIDAIRSMSSAFRDCSETPVSMLSRPDFTENQPAIYNQIAYAITSDSDQESVDPERTDEQRDMRFERIVRTNLDRYPLDYDRNQTNVPGKVSNTNTTVDRLEDASDVLQVKCDNKADLVLCNPFDEGKPKVMSYNRFEDDRSTTASDCCSAANDKKPENPKIEEPKPDVTGCNPFEEGKSDVMEQNEKENIKVADVESLKKEPAGRHRRSNCVRIKGGKDGETKHSPARQMQQTDDCGKVGELEASSQVTETDRVPLTRGMGVTHEVRVLEASNRIEERNPGQMGVSDKVEKLDHPQSSKDDFDDDDDDLDLPLRRREESFNTMLKAYIPSAAQTKIRTLDAIIDNLPHFEESEETVQEDYSSSGWASSSTVDDNSVDDRAEQQAEFLFQISVERGLSQQCYQCRNCARAIGMFYDQDRVCAFDGYHYCHECHENKEHCIPAKVVYNWDFRPYKVSNLSFDFLQKNFETPLLDIESLNIKLYGHVKPLDTILMLRTQLRFVKSYMMTCTQAVGLEFMEKFNGQSYLFDKIHLYSLKDLTLVPSGALQKRLQKIVKFATGHVYGCPRCCQKGFYCEICRIAKVIYPFETSSTFRCQDCKAVYHSHCKTHLVPCPKCKRMSERENILQKAGSDPIDSVDYSYQLENGNCHGPT